MEHHLRSQIRDNCRLGLPEGIKELMSDISREVLRAQPLDLYNFISNYLSVMLMTRENLSIAARICGDVCAGACYRELDDELRFIGLEEEEAIQVKEVIQKYFEKGGSNEASLIIKLMKSTNLNGIQMAEVKNCVQKAFKRHLINNTILYESSSDSDLDEITRATKHTLQIYRKTNISTIEYERASANVQASYKAYGVKRYKCPKESEITINTTAEKTINLDNFKKTQSDGTEAAYQPDHMLTVSSSTLAGSYLNLPKYVPYSVHNSEVIDKLEEYPRSENRQISFDRMKKTDTSNKINSEENKKISFQDIPEEYIEDEFDYTDEETNAVIDEPANVEASDEIQSEIEEQDDDEVDNYDVNY